ncbi:MAG: hypothetical protein ACR2M1_13115, partial [Gemmatimonadaceae bacterium]
MMRAIPAATARQGVIAADTLVQCLPVETPVKHSAVIRRRPRPSARPRGFMAAAPAKMAPKLAPKIATTPKPVVAAALRPRRIMQGVRAVS